MKSIELKQIRSGWPVPIEILLSGLVVVNLRVATDYYGGQWN